VWIWLIVPEDIVGTFSGGMRSAAPRWPVLWYIVRVWLCWMSQLWVLILELRRSVLDYFAASQTSEAQP